MRAYKGFTKELISRLGNGEKETCCFTPGETKEVEASKTVSSGFHCCENPFECLAYYAFDGSNRFFIVEAAGDIDEDDDERIACTKITPYRGTHTIRIRHGGHAVHNNPSCEEKMAAAQDRCDSSQQQGRSQGKRLYCHCKRRTPVCDRR